MKKIYARIYICFTWRLIMLIITLGLLSVAAHAQTQPATVAAAKPPSRPEDEISSKMRAARNDPPQVVELIVKLVKEFPESMAAESAGYSFASALRKQAKLDNDPGKLRALADRYKEGTASAPAQLRVRANSSAITAMIDNNLAGEAVELARQTIPLLDEREFIEARRKGYQRDIERASKAVPNYKPKPFNETDYVEMFRGTKAQYYALMGRGLANLDKTEEAEQAYRQSLDIEANAPAAIGIATLLQKRGEDKEALGYAAGGMLTGRMDKSGIALFHDLYRKTHGGNLEGAEEYLDARYRESYRNPVKGERHSRLPGQTARVVLAEFFTGAGCVPCIAFDYSFETDLEDYSRNELMFLAYHWHAPTMDPMGNRSSDARVKYYGIKGAPTVFLDGKKFVTHDDDARSRTEASGTAQRVYAALNARINSELQTPPQGRIKLDAKAVNGNVEASVAADIPKGEPSDVTLQIALVENQVHYSGENGLRFHLMVVRNLARQAASEDYGFKIGQTRSVKINYVFNVNDIIAQNLRYYTEYPEERRKEFAARVGAEAASDIAIDFAFKEERNVINPANLSVVAFLQDNKTKEILQASYLPVGRGR